MTTFLGILAPVLLMAVLLAIVAPVRWWWLPRRWRFMGGICAALMIALFSLAASAQQPPPTPFGLLPLANSGLVVSHIDSTASNNSTLIFATTGQQSISSVFGINVVNTNSATAYLKFYDKATAPICQTDPVKMVFQLPQNVTITKGFLMGIPFKNGIGICIVANVISTDNTNATTGISVDIAHK